MKRWVARTHKIKLTESEQKYVNTKIIRNRMLRDFHSHLQLSLDLDDSQRPQIIDGE